MNRQTSIEAYKALLESGELSRQRFVVLQFIYEHPNCTTLDCENHFRKQETEDKIKSALGCGYHQRFSELVAMGLVAERGLKMVGTRMRITYSVTGETTIRKLSRPKKQDAYFEQAVAALSNILYSVSTMEQARTTARNVLFDIGYLK